MTGDIESSSVESNPAAAAPSPERFFFPENNDGNGWLIERPWLGVRVGLVWPGAPRLLCPGGGRLGMPNACSSISDSVTLIRAGEAAFPLAMLWPGSLRALGERSRPDQGGIAELVEVDGESQMAHRLRRAHRVDPTLAGEDGD